MINLFEIKLTMKSTKPMLVNNPFTHYLGIQVLSVRPIHSTLVKVPNLHYKHKPV